MTRYMFYFHYWLTDEPIQAVIDFDPKDKAKILFEEVYEEITYHIGDEPEPESLIFVEMYGLRPFNPLAWEMPLDEFVGNYGNTFVVFDLKQPHLGHLEHFQPKQVAGGLRSKYQHISATSDEWPHRAPFETRLVSTLIRFFQFYRKTKWLLVTPIDAKKNESRVWKVTAAIPETTYTAEFRIILGDRYPEEHPLLFIRKSDLFIANDYDPSLIWIDSDGTKFFNIPDANADSTRWEDDQYLVDFILTGFWNFLVRSLHRTFSRLLFYKVNVGQKSVILDLPEEQRIVRQSAPTSIDEGESEDDPDWRVQIAEAMEDIIIDQKALDSKIKEEDGYEEDDNSFPSSNTENDDDEKDSSTQSGPQETKYQDWIFAKDDSEGLDLYAMFFTWLFLRIPERALKELGELKDFVNDHPIFQKIEWNLIIDSIAPSKLELFAEDIIPYFHQKTEHDEIYDTDREFLRDTVLKTWSDKKGVPELRELLKARVKNIRKVEYVSISIE